MQLFYVSWSYRFQGMHPRTGYEYVIHPSRSDSGASYCTALFDAADEVAAWKRISAAFPGSIRHLIEPASNAIQANFSAIKKSPGMLVVPGK